MHSCFPTHLRIYGIPRVDCILGHYSRPQANHQHLSDPQTPNPVKSQRGELNCYIWSKWPNRDFSLGGTKVRLKKIPRCIFQNTRTLLREASPTGVRSNISSSTIKIVFPCFGSHTSRIYAVPSLLPSPTPHEMLPYLEIPQTFQGAKDIFPLWQMQKKIGDKFSSGWAGGSSSSNRSAAIPRWVCSDYHVFALIFLVCLFY